MTLSMIDGLALKTSQLANSPSRAAQLTSYFPSRIFPSKHLVHLYNSHSDFGKRHLEHYAKCSHPRPLTASRPFSLTSVIVGCPARAFTMRPILVMATPAIERGTRAVAGAVNSSS